MSHKVIITGASGMVGRGVLLECLDDVRIVEVLMVNRRPLGISHPKLREVLLADFMDVPSIAEEFRDFDACFYCMGVSALGLSEAEYTRLTFDLAKAWADAVYAVAPGAVFNYVSGQGTDSSERGRLMWARVKGRTENYVLGHGFRDAYAFRAGFILPERGIRSPKRSYNTVFAILRPLFPLFRHIDAITSTTRMGRAMIATLDTRSSEKHLSNSAINRLAEAAPPS